MQVGRADQERAWPGKPRHSLWLAAVTIFRTNPFTLSHCGLPCAEVHRPGGGRRPQLGDPRGAEGLQGRGGGVRAPHARKRHAFNEQCSRPVCAGADAAQPASPAYYTASRPLVPPNANCPSVACTLHTRAAAAACGSAHPHPLPTCRLNNNCFATPSLGHSTFHPILVHPTLPTTPLRCFYSLPPCYPATLQAPARLTSCRCRWAPPRPAGGMWVYSAPWRRQVHQWPSACLVMAAGRRLRVPPPCPVGCAVPVAGCGEEWGRAGCTTCACWIESSRWSPGAAAAAGAVDLWLEHQSAAPQPSTCCLLPAACSC